MLTKFLHGSSRRRLVMKFLFVSNFYDDEPCGGRVLARAHYDALCRITDGGGGM